MLLLSLLYLYCNLSEFVGDFGTSDCWNTVELCMTRLHRVFWGCIEYTARHLLIDDTKIQVGCIHAGLPRIVCLSNRAEEAGARGYFITSICTLGGLGTSTCSTLSCSQGLSAFPKWHIFKVSPPLRADTGENSAVICWSSVVLRPIPTHTSSTSRYQLLARAFCNQTPPSKIDSDYLPSSVPWQSRQTDSSHVRHPAIPE